MPAQHREVAAELYEVARLLAVVVMDLRALAESVQEGSGSMESRRAYDRVGPAVLARLRSAGRRLVRLVEG